MSYNIEYTGKFLINKEVTRKHEREYNDCENENVWDIKFSGKDEQCHLEHSGFPSPEDISQLVRACEWLGERGYGINGTMTWVGDEMGDTGVIIVENNQVKSIDTSPTKFIELMQTVQNKLGKVNMPARMELQGVLNSFVVHHNQHGVQG